MELLYIIEYSFETTGIFHLSPNPGITGRDNCPRVLTLGDDGFIMKRRGDDEHRQGTLICLLKLLLKENLLKRNTAMASLLSIELRNAEI